MIGHPLKVRELLDEISRGEILLPEFQRSYVWRPRQVVRLIDSLYREYPTGQVLLWDTGEALPTKGLEGVRRSELANVGRPKIVLDGQQRLTSIHRALDPTTENPIEVLFNLESQHFVPHQERLLKDPRWVAVRAVLSQDRHDLELLQQVAAQGGPKLDDPACGVYLDRLRRLRRILEYPVPIEIFRGDSFEEVIELFIRINSGGTRLHHAELVLAQLTLRLPGTIADAMEELIEEMRARDFTLDSRFLVRALVSVGTGQSRFRSLDELWALAPDDLEQVWQRTEGALRRVVEFVRRDARLPGSSWLPSMNALVPLVAFFAHHPDPARGLKAGLLRWFYLASLRSRFGTSPEARLDEDLRAVAGDKPVVALLEALLASAGSLAVEPAELERTGRRSPLFSLSLAAAVQGGAVDWFSGVTLSPGQPAVGHPVFSPAELKRACVPRAEQEELANLVFLAAKPGVEASRRSAGETLAAATQAGQEVLAAQSIPLDRELWQPERYHEFLAARRDLLAAAINRLLDAPLG